MVNSPSPCMPADLGRRQRQRRLGQAIHSPGTKPWVAKATTLEARQIDRSDRCTLASLPRLSDLAGSAPSAAAIDLSSLGGVRAAAAAWQARPASTPSSRGLERRLSGMPRVAIGRSGSVAAAAEATDRSCLFGCPSACSSLNKGSPKPISLSRGRPCPAAACATSAAPPPTAPSSPHGCAPATARCGSRQTSALVLTSISATGAVGKQRKRQQAERAVGDHDQALLFAPAVLDRLKQRRIELVGERRSNGGISGTASRLRLQRRAQPAHLGLELDRLQLDPPRRPPLPSLGTAHTKLASWPK